LGYCTKYENIKYFKLLKKGGVDFDYNIAVSYASGGMCWLFTDDDIIKNGAVSKILNLISEETNLIVINSEVRDIDLKMKIVKSKLNIKNNIVYREGDFNYFFENTINYLSFIGAVIINRKIWAERNKENYYGTEFIHLGVIFQELMPGNCIVVAEPLIIIRYGNAQWVERSFEIWMFKWPKLLWSFQSISEVSKQKVTSKEPWRIFNKLILHRLNGDYNYTVFNKILLKKSTSKIWSLIAILISILPRIPLKFIDKGITFSKKVLNN